LVIAHFRQIRRLFALPVRPLHCILPDSLVRAETSHQQDAGDGGCYSLIRLCHGRPTEATETMARTGSEMNMTPADGSRRINGGSGFF
jgi:hypothetical protein